MSEREKLEQEIRNLISQLTAPTSDVGDWKINKIYEYRMLGKDDPYNFEKLAEEREEIRQKINELQKRIKELPEEEIQLDVNDSM